MMIDGHTLKQALTSGVWKAFIDDRAATLDDLNIGTNSVDLTLGARLLRQTKGGVVDPVDDPASLTWQEELPNANGKFLLKPGDFCLGFARERFEAHEPLCIDHQVYYKDDEMDYSWCGVNHEMSVETLFVPMFEGRSTLGRLGLAMHITAGFGDYGFDANFTMEINNVSSRVMLLTPGMRVAQLHFESVTPGVQHMFYKGAYAGKNGGPHAPVLGRDRFFSK